MEITKNTRIKNELDRISFFFEEIDGNQRAILAPLLQNAAFMMVTLEDLQEIIISEGVTEKYQNGANQHGIKQSATLQSYNALIKNYSAVIKTLSQYLPPEKKQSFTNPWMVKPAIMERTEEEREKDLALAVEYQRLCREDKDFAKNTNFSTWKSQQLQKV